MKWLAIFLFALAICASDNCGGHGLRWSFDGTEHTFVIHGDKR